MTSITIDIEIDRPIDIVWEELRHIERHVTWMSDAQRIEFNSDQREGVGTTFDCYTKIAVFSTRDVMTITRWEPPMAMGVTHHGLVTGRGEFALRDIDGSTHLHWSEELDFPWWFGAKLGEWCARPVLRRVWRKNLENLAVIVEDSTDKGSPTA